MANRFGTDILIQVQDPRAAARFYVKLLGFEIADDNPKTIGLEGKHINLFIEPRPPLGPVLEVTIGNVENAKAQLLKNGCEIVKDEPGFPNFSERLSSAQWIHHCPHQREAAIDLLALPCTDYDDLEEGTVWKQRAIRILCLMFACCMAASSTEPQNSKSLPTVDARQQMPDLGEVWVAAEVEHAL